MKFIRNSLRIKILSTLFIIYFLYASGFVYQFLGGYAYLQLNNFGEDYDKFYTHQIEVNSAIWLSRNRNNKSQIFADEVSALRLYSFGNVDKYLDDVENTILPGVITKNSYVYLSYANVVRDRTDAHYENTALIYAYPNEFLAKNKNLIYNNGGSKIFK